MTTTPKIIGPDGVAREDSEFSTTLPERFFYGVIDEQTVDMQISIRGGSFVSNPDLIVFEGTSFTVPNPSVFPDGLDLAAGTNEILVRSVATSGSVSSPARISVVLVQEADLGSIGQPPSNITVERLDNAVVITAEALDDTNVTGYNFHASRFTGGGATGYRRVNLNPISDTTTKAETEVLQVIEADSNVATNPDGTHAADPLYVQLKQTQTRGGDVIERLEDVTLTDDLASAITYQEQASLLQSDFTDVTEVPETAFKLRTTITVETVRERQFVSFVHNRLAGSTSNPATVPVGEFTATPIAEDLFYVVTAVTFDPELRIEFESPFSIEVAGNPVTVRQTLGNFPVVTRQDLQQQTITSILRTNPTIALQPGAVIRDIFVDPFAGEAERVRFIIDFFHRTQSFDTLLRIDGVDEDGNPTAVQNSAYKTALQRAFNLQRAGDVQAVIDQAFEQLAAKLGQARLPGIRAAGEVTFFTSTRPTQTIPIPLGTRLSAGSTQYTTTQESGIPFESVASFFDPVSGLFSVDVPVRAEIVGTTGNVARGQIRSVVSGVSGLQVINASETFGGENLETNFDLAVRSKNAIASVDSGTEAGYRRTLAAVPGVLEVVIVTPGDALMQRDFDTDYNKHALGKVDIYIRGENLATVTDTFAFSFETSNDAQFKIKGNPDNLVFESLDTRLTPDNPIAEMLDFPEIGLGFRNATRGSDFNLTGVTILDYKTIQLDDSLSQPASALGDVLLGDFRFLSTNDFILPRQPVGSVQGVTGQIAGGLSDDQFALWRTDNPLLDGRSTEARSFVRVSPASGVPTGNLITVQNESHIVIGEFTETMNNLGVNTLTIAVFNQDRTIEYRGPNHPSGVSDYTIISGSATAPAAIVRIPSGAILSGERLLVDYQHNENFTVEYTVNLAVSTAQRAINGRKGKHITADVLAKQAVGVPVDISATIIRKPGFPVNAVDRGVRTNLTQFFNSLPMGTPVRQSDLDAVIERTDGVSFVDLPFTKLVRAPSSCVIRESLRSSQTGDTTLLEGTQNQPLGSESVLVWLIEDPLNSATNQGGGPVTEFRGVTKDDRDLDLQTVNFQALGEGPGRAFIIGNAGLSIPGFSDNDTLEELYPTANASELEAQRQKLTSNRVAVSLPVGESPTASVFTVTYVVSAVNSGTKNLDAFDIEFFTVGTLDFTHAEDG